MSSPTGFVFKGDAVFSQGDEYEFALDGLHSGGAGVLRCSLELPAPWRAVAPWVEVSDAFPAPPGGEWLGLRSVWSRFGDEAFARAGTAWQYMNWLRSERFCRACGSALTPRAEERGLVCSGGCGRVYYAPIHPAVIVAIEREGKLLLAHNKQMPEGRYSVLAGFVEPGESLERTVRREVMEEVGIEINGLRYFGSQSWPFPCSLMIGFTAHWLRGEVTPDGTELSDARWFAPDEFPDIPPGMSISRRLINNFAAQRTGGTVHEPVA